LFFLVVVLPNSLNTTSPIIVGITIVAIIVGTVNVVDPVTVVDMTVAIILPLHVPSG